jgi:hypothetical protein
MSERGLSDNASIIICLAIIVLGMSSCQAVTEFAHAKYPEQKCSAPEAK